MSPPAFLFTELVSSLHRSCMEISFAYYASADSCPNSLQLPYRALPIQRPPVEQAVPDKNVICHYTTAAFTVSPKPMALSCGADLPGDLALYAVSVRRLIALRSGLDAPCDRSRLRRAFRFAPPSDDSSRNRPCFRLLFMFLSLDRNRIYIQGLIPRKITPAPGVRNPLKPTQVAVVGFRQAQRRAA